MDRGRQIATAARRRSDLQRLVDAKKVKVMVALPGHPFYDRREGQMNLFYVDGVQVASQNDREADYPSEFVMATLQLAVSATVGYDGVAPPVQTHRVSAEAKAYNAALKKANANRPDMQ
jgi:hypothetical protein